MDGAGQDGRLSFDHGHIHSLRLEGRFCVPRPLCNHDSMYVHRCVQSFKHEKNNNKTKQNKKTTKLTNKQKTTKNKPQTTTTTKQTNKQTKNRVEYRELSSSRSNTSFTDGQQQGWWSWDLATVTMSDRGLKLSPRPSTVGNCIVWYCNVYLSLVNLKKQNKTQAQENKCWSQELSAPNRFRLFTLQPAPIPRSLPNRHSAAAELSKNNLPKNLYQFVY